MVPKSAGASSKSSGAFGMRFKESCTSPSLLGLAGLAAVVSHQSITDTESPANLLKKTESCLFLEIEKET